MESTIKVLAGYTVCLEYELDFGHKRMACSLIMHFPGSKALSRGAMRPTTIHYLWT